MYQGPIYKMYTEYNDPIDYYFIIGGHKIFLNSLINTHITFEWTGRVECICGQQFSKFYRQNFCYKCYWNAPQASQSIFKPELCTADLGIEERDLEWEKEFQISPHYVYLSNSSGIKIGITRKNNELTRWIDQGAVQGIVLAEVPNRRLSGLIEIELKQHVSDRTNWRKMLSGNPASLNLVDQKKHYIKYIPEDLQEFIIENNKVTEISYPVSVYPSKIKSLSFAKHNVIQGKLIGVKGQYLLFENNTVFNVRSHGGYISTMLF